MYKYLCIIFQAQMLYICLAKQNKFRSDRSLALVRISCGATIIITTTIYLSALRALNYILSICCKFD